MKNEKLILFILAAVQFAHIIDFMIIMPLGKQLMEIFEINPQQFTLIVTAYSLAAFLAGLVGAVIIDKYDRKKALIFAFLGFMVGTLACGLATSYLTLLTARAIAGLFGGVLSTLVLSIIGDIIPYERRATAMGIILTAFSAASVIGVPAGLWLAAKFSWRMPFFVVVGLGIFVLLGMIFFLPSLTKHFQNDAPKTNPLHNITAVFRDKNQIYALLFTMILVLGHFLIIPFIAPYMQLNVGFSDTEVAYLYLFGGLTTVVALPLFGKLGDSYGNFKIFAYVSIAAVFSIYAITTLPEVSLIVALLASSSYFIVSSGRNVPATTMVTAVVTAEKRGSFMSMRTSVQQLAMGLSSVIAGLIVVEGENGQLINYEIVGYCAIIMSILAVVVGRLLKVVKEE